MKYEALAQAKINLGLHVIRRRDDGFHDIESVLLRIPWADRISVVPDDMISLSCTDPALPVDERNLCLRAAHALAATTREEKGARIHLEKTLPFGSGLGGGSSDAATTLRLLVDLWDVRVEEGQLREVASELGSDVPFFLGPPAALAQGRGERLTPLLDDTGSPYVLPFNLVVVVPPVAVSTTEAYSMVRAQDRRTKTGHFADIVRSNNLDRWRIELANDFEEPVLARYPAIAAAKQMLLDSGAGYASLSGSGSSVFGIFPEEGAARAAAQAAAIHGHRVWSGCV